MWHVCLAYSVLALFHKLFFLQRKEAMAYPSHPVLAVHSPVCYFQLCQRSSDSVSARQSWLNVLPCITQVSTPDVREEDLTSEDEVIIMASDGLWDVIANQEAVNIIKDTPVQTASPEMPACA